MRHTQPLSLEEGKLDLALRQMKRSHVEQDMALTQFRLAALRPLSRPDHLLACTDLLLGEVLL
jgi:hypothetical protein